MTWDNRLKFQVSSADPDSASPVWVDLSSRVVDNVQLMDLTNGRTNVLDDLTTPGQPGQLTLVLDNRDGALTYGNSTSPYASWWGPGRKCRLLEKVFAGQADITDTFARTVSSNWGSADTGQGWTTNGGSASEYAVSGGSATHVMNAVNDLHRCLIPFGSTNFDITVDVSVNVATPTVAGAQQRICGRVADASNFYMAQLQVTTAPVVQLGIMKVIGGSLTTVVSLTTILSSHASNEVWRVRFQGNGSLLRAMTWRPASDSVPSTWQVSGTDTSITSGTQIMLASRLDAGNTNALPVTFTWDSVTVVDPLSQRFTGYLQMPTEVVTTDGMESRVAISAVDRLGRLSQGRPFVSTLGAHIMGSVRNSALKGYWPLNDAAVPFVNALGGQSGAKANLISSSPSVNRLPSVGFGQAPPLPGDDVSGLTLTPGLTGSNVETFPPVVQVAPDFSLGGTLTAGQVVTLVGWFNRDVSDQSLSIPIFIAMNNNISGLGLSSVSFLINYISDTLGNHWNAVYFDPPPAGAANVPAANGSADASSRWYALAIRWGFTPNVLELWVDGARYTGTFTSTVTASTVTSLQFQNNGGVAHLQYYIGAPTDFAFADFTAQIQVGLTGLEGQTTGTRADSVLQYAGVPGTDYTAATDTGQSVMQVARLSGKDPLTALREAETTEQGLLYVDGSGQIHFADRLTLYGI